MFNDERITLEMGKLKKLIILISGIIAFAFVIAKIFYSISDKLPFHLISTEIVILLCSIGSLIGSLFIKSEVKDELYYQRKANYYNKAFKIILYIVFISFALIVPATVKTPEYTMLPSNECINIIMLSSIFFGYGYLRFNNIYFNYNIIEEDSKVYWKNVFKNVLKILVFFGIIYGISLFVSFFYMLKKFNINLLITIIGAFITTVISNGGYYIFISFLERLFIKEENKKKITTPTLILIIIASSFLILSYIINCIYYVIATNGISLPNGMKFTQVLAIASNYNKLFIEYRRFFGGLSVIFLLADLMKFNSINKGKYKGILTAFTLYLIDVIVSSITNEIFAVSVLNMQRDSVLMLETVSKTMVLINSISILKTLIFNTTILVLLLVFFRKELFRNKLIVFIIIGFFVSEFIKMIAFALEKIELIYITSLIIVVLSFITLIFIIKKYKNISNIYDE